MDCEQSSDEAKNSFVGDYLSLALLDIFPYTFPVPIPTAVTVVLFTRLFGIHGQSVLQRTTPYHFFRLLLKTLTENR